MFDFKGRQPLRAVFFDLDETLVKNTTPFRELAAHLHAQFAAHMNGVTMDQFWDVLWPAAVEMWNSMIDGTLPGDAARLRAFETVVNTLAVDSCLASTMMEASDRGIVEATRLCDDAVPVLESLRRRNVQIGIVTNGFTTVQCGKAARHGLDGYVDFVLPSEQAGAHKPDPAIYMHALNRVGVSAEETLFVGDTLENDVYGPISVGMSAALIDPTGKYRHENLGSAVRIERLSEVLELFSA